MSQPDTGFVFGYPQDEPTTVDQAELDREAAQESAKAFLRDHLNVDTAQLTDALAAVYGDAYASGVIAALDLDGSKKPVPGVTLDIPTNAEEWGSYWSNWAPGSIAAANLLRDVNGGLAELLDQAGITIQGIAGTMLDRLGNLLALGVAQGDSIDAIANRLYNLVGDQARAYMIANTEVARAVTLGSMAQYRQDGITQGNLLTSPGACKECEAIASVNPQPLKDLYVPVHPNCRCSVSPELSSIPDASTLNSDLLTLGGAAAVTAAGEIDAGLLAGEEGESLASRAEDEFNALNPSQPDEQQTAPSQAIYEKDITDLLGENQGGGMLYEEQNTGAGMSALEQNTGAGDLNINQENAGGGLTQGQENQGGSGDADLLTADETQPTLEPETIAEPAPTPAPTKRTRKRVRTK